ncbi:unnamed protein product, partial [Prorocentrum cordatum]
QPPPAQARAIRASLASPCLGGRHALGRPVDVRPPPAGAVGMPAAAAGRPKAADAPLGGVGLPLAASAWLLSRWPGCWPPLAPQLAGVGAAQGPLAALAGQGAALARSAARSAAARAAELFGFAILLKQKKMMKGVHGTLNPSLWRWYHRHGYWARRRKLIDFGTYRRWRYHEVEGPGKRGHRYAHRFNQWWMDKSYYKPIKNYCRF